MTLRARALSSVGWTTGAKIAQQAFQFGLSIVLMRLLGPRAFGLIGMVLVFSGFAALLAELGFSSALVQRPEITEEHRSTMFWFNLGTAGILTLALFLAAPLLAAFYREPLLRPITAWSAFNFVLGSAGTVPRAMLQKQLRFEILARVDVAALVVSGLAAAAVAAAGGGVWSLVVQPLVASALDSALLLLVGRWRPRLLWSGPALRELLGFGAGLTGFNIVNYWARSADKMLIGRFLGSAELGLYSRAYSLMLLPLTQIVSVLAPVMLPVLSSIQDDQARVRRAFLRVIRVLSFVTFPMMLGLVVVAPSFVRGVLGAKWTDAIPLIQILAVAGMTQTLCNPTGWIYTSQGRTDWMFWWGVGGSGFLIVSIVIGVLFRDVRAVALAYLGGNLIITIPCLAIPGRLIGMTVRDVWQAVHGNLLCAVAMAIVVWAVGRLLPADMKPLLQFAIQVPTGVFAYAALAYLTRQSAMRELTDIRLHFASRQTELAPST